MKKIVAILSLVLCSSLCAKADESIIPGLMPGMTSYFKPGKTYFTPDNPGHFGVIQALPSGVMVNPRPMAFPGLPDPKRFFVETSRVIADDDLLPSHLCMRYKGLMRYTTALGVISTIPKFSESSCSPLPKIVKKKEEKKESKSVKAESPAQLEYNGKKYSISNGEIDNKRWVKVLNIPPSSAALYIDKQTVQMDTVNIVRTTSGPPVQYTFWARIAGNHKISDPIQSSVQCWQIPNVPPESIDEKIYQFFCNTPEARNVKTPSEIESAKAFEASKVANEKAAKEQEQLLNSNRLGMSILSAGSVLNYALQGIHRP